MRGRSDAVLDVKAHRRVGLDPGLDALQPVVPPAQRLLEEADRGTGGDGVREGVWPRTDEALAWPGQPLQQARDAVGVAVGPAADGVDGLKMAAEERPDLALVDTRLPKMDGYEVCRRIKVMKGLDAGVIMFTAYGDAVNVAKAKEVGADDFLAKTEDFANMHRAIKKLLGEK